MEVIMKRLLEAFTSFLKEVSILLWNAIKTGTQEIYESFYSVLNV